MSNFFGVLSNAGPAGPPGPPGPAFQYGSPTYYVTILSGTVYAYQSHTATAQFSASTTDVVLANIVNALAGTRATVHVSADIHTLLTDPNLPSTVALVLPNGAILSHGTTSFSAYGPLAAGPYQIFAGSGQVNLGQGSCDGVRPEWFRQSGDTDDTTAWSKAITAAQGMVTSQGTVEAQPRIIGAVGKKYTISSGFNVQRNTVIDLHGAIINYNAASGTAFTFHTASDGGWEAGGVRNGRITDQVSNNTATAIQIGSGTDNAQGIHFANLEVDLFQTGVKITSGVGGLAFLMELNDCRVHNCSEYCVLWDCPNGAEQCTIFGGSYFAGTIADLFATSASSGVDITVIGGSIDSAGSNGNLVKIDGNAIVTSLFHGTHFEHDNAPTASMLVFNNGNHTLHGCQLYKGDSGGTTAPLIVANNTSLDTNGCFIHAQNLNSSLIGMSGLCSVSVTDNQFFAAAFGASALLFDTTGLSNSFITWLNNAKVSWSQVPTYAAMSAGNKLFTDEDPQSGGRMFSGPLSYPGHIQPASGVLVSHAFPVIAGNIALSAGWGSTASSSIGTASSSQRGSITVTAGGSGIAANPTVTLTYPSAYPVANPYPACTRGDTNSPTGPLAAVATTTTLTITFVGTPVSGTSYTLNYVLLG